MIKQTGIDIIENKRIKLKDNLLVKFLSVNELKRYNSFTNKKRKREFAAGRWAAKEAIIKSSQDKLQANKIDIGYLPNGAPIILNEELKNIKISISHDNKYSIAIAINEEE